jgi:hypothetical protein
LRSCLCTPCSAVPREWPAIDGGIKRGSEVQTNERLNETSLATQCCPLCASRSAAPDGDLRRGHLRITPKRFGLCAHGLHRVCAECAPTVLGLSSGSNQCRAVSRSRDRNHLGKRPVLRADLTICHAGLCTKTGFLANGLVCTRFAHELTLRTVRAHSAPKSAQSYYSK